MFDIGFRTSIRLSRHRKPQPGVFRETVPVKLDRASQDAVVTAYQVDESDGGRQCSFAVVRFGGRLFWPLRSEYGGPEATLSAARAGEINLFGENLLSRASEIVGDDWPIAWFDADGCVPKVSDIQRKASDLLLVGDTLYAVGGVPAVALIGNRLKIVSTGGGREGRPLESGLALQPGGFGLPETDFAFSAKQFWFADDLVNRGATVTGLPLDANICIKEIAGEPVDLFRMRLDAAFRQIDALARRRSEKWPVWKWYDLDALIDRAIKVGPDLDERRMNVIHGALALFGPLSFDVEFPGCSRKILKLIDLAEKRGLIAPDLGIGGTLTAEDSDFLSSWIGLLLEPRKKPFEIELPRIKRWRGLKKP